MADSDSRHKNKKLPDFLTRGRLSTERALELEKDVAKLLKDLPELLADYERCALDADGNLDSFRGKRIKNMKELLSKIQAEGKSKLETGGRSARTERLL